MIVKKAIVFPWSLVKLKLLVMLKRRPMFDEYDPIEEVGIDEEEMEVLDDQNKSDYEGLIGDES